VAESGLSTFVAECFWPDVRETDLEALDRRVAGVVVTTAAGAHGVRYLGSILMRGDDVVLCEFEGTEDAVREVAERAGIPFERILETVRSPEAQ
jgi:Nickel responsive protein SCO4226-like